MRPSISLSLLALPALLFAVGCAHHQTVVADVPQTAPSLAPSRTAPPHTPPAASNSGRILATPAPPGGVNDDDLDFIAHHKPIWSETGHASWYSAPYKGRKSANGQVFDDHALTAAHRTLPMGSLLVVTNLKTGQSSPMRVTDRGPFVPDRNLDLTIAAAKALGVYLPGTAPIRVDVYRTPKPIEVGGRWCVQFGAFTHEHLALKLKKVLQEKFPDAQVIEFPGENAFWVRIRPAGDDRKQAESIARRVKIKEGQPYLTRLD